MGADRDITHLRRRLRTLIRAANNIAAHIDTLHSLAYDATRGDTEPDRAGFESRPPPGYRTETTRAQHMWARTNLEIGRCEDLLVGLERDLAGCLFAGSSNAEPSRGSLISAAEHERLLTNQRGRPDTPARLVDQPRHPGAKR